MKYRLSLKLSKRGGGKKLMPIDKKLHQNQFVSRPYTNEKARNKRGYQNSEYSPCISVNTVNRCSIFMCTHIGIQKNQTVVISLALCRIEGSSVKFTYNKNGV